MKEPKRLRFFVFGCEIVANSVPRIREAAMISDYRVDRDRDSDWLAGATDLTAQLEATGPDLVLLDLGLPGTPAGELLSGVRKVHPRTSVIVLSGRPEAEDAALVTRADTFVSKTGLPKRHWTLCGPLGEQ